MSPSAIVAIEFALVLAVVLGLGIWQLVSVRREIARDREKARAQREAAQQADAGRGAAANAPAAPSPDDSRP